MMVATQCMADQEPVRPVGVHPPIGLIPEGETGNRLTVFEPKGFRANEILEADQTDFAFRFLST